MSATPPSSPPRAVAVADPRATAARGAMRTVIPRRPRVVGWSVVLVGLAFALAVTPAVTAERWLRALGAGEVVAGRPAELTVRVALFDGHDGLPRQPGRAIVVARGDVATPAQAAVARSLAAAAPSGPAGYLALLGLFACLGAIFSHHVRRSNHGRLVRVQLASLGTIALAAAAAKIALATTVVSALASPVALFALVPTLVLDRVVGLATAVLAALVFAFLTPFDVGVAVVLLVQASAAGIVVAERPRRRGRAALTAGAVTTLLTALTYPLLMYVTHGQLPLAELRAPATSAWVAAVAGPALATALAPLLVAPYQRLVGEITRARLVALEELSNPLLRQIAERSPGTWQHSLMMANLAEIAADAIGADGRLVRVGAYYHDLGKSLQPKYFIENLEPGEESPHDQLPPEVSCDAIFAHVTEGIVAARRAGLHERIIDFMHMHHGDGVLEYFWARCREQGNPRGLSIEQFRYPGHPPQSRETAILAICDAVEAASRTLRKADPQAIDQLVQRIVYGKLHLGQLDESGLSMSDLRRLSDSMRETIRHANHGRIEYPWQRAGEDASASASTGRVRAVTSSPRLDSLDQPRPSWAQTPAGGRRPTSDARDAALGTETTALRVDGAAASPATSPDDAQAAIAATAPVTLPAEAFALPAAGASPRVAAARPPADPFMPSPAAVVRAAVAPIEPAGTRDGAAPAAPATRAWSGEGAGGRRGPGAPGAPAPGRAPDEDVTAVATPQAAESRRGPAGGRRPTTGGVANGDAGAMGDRPSRPRAAVEEARAFQPPEGEDLDRGGRASAGAPGEDPGLDRRSGRASRGRLPLPAPPSSDPALALPHQEPADALAALAEPRAGGPARARTRSELQGIPRPPGAGPRAATSPPVQGEAPARAGGEDRDRTRMQTAAEVERLSRGAGRDVTVVAAPAPELLRDRTPGVTREIEAVDIESTTDVLSPAGPTTRGATTSIGRARTRPPGGE